MSLKEREYSVLLVSASEKLNTALSDLLPESRYRPVRTVSSVSAGKRAWSERSYDFVIINSPLPDDTGIRFAIDAAGSAGSVVLLLVRAELQDDMRDKVVEHGVYTLAKPLSRPLVSLALDWLAAARERLRKLEKKAQKERKIFERYLEKERAKAERKAAREAEKARRKKEKDQTH